MKGKGILLPIFSLPNDFGIGSLGKGAYNFVDFLKASNQNYWQVLPTNPTSYGDSPYQTLASYAGNPYFIDLDILKNDGLLTAEECNNEKTPLEKINYENLFNTRYIVLHKAFARFKENIPNDFGNFLTANAFWLEAYSLFMSIKTHFNNVSWLDFGEYKDYNFAKNNSAKFTEDILFWQFIQYEFYKQWKNLKAYANSLEIKIIGDMPIYVSLDSVDVWSAPQYFMLDDNYLPTKVAGVPPDAFSESGQLWGNPLYNWGYMKSENFAWWIKRFKFILENFDSVRIDHFRGFSAYYAIPYGETTAKKGKWEKALGKELFNEVAKVFPNADLIAEDLGVIDAPVRELIRQTGYKGMKILQFAFDSDNSEYLPRNYSENCVAYTGTHDNDTSLTFLSHATKAQRASIDKETERKPFESRIHAFVRCLIESKADMVIIPMCDYLRLYEGRINAPSTTENNWQWRLDKDYKEKTLKYILSF